MIQRYEHQLYFIETRPANGTRSTWSRIRTYYPGPKEAEAHRRQVQSLYHQYSPPLDPLETRVRSCTGAEVDEDLD
jgi:hypothetical protein